ncbi:MAG TPA: hypothetical protein VGO59_16140 [Verrucomicrobiae bacterium]|jgi:hypothetical protein
MIARSRWLHQVSGQILAGVLAIGISFYGIGAATAADQPRIVNIYNFIRDNDFRVADSETVLFKATSAQVQLLNEFHLPATFAFQYDALMDTNYQKLFAGPTVTNFELAAWWEIPELLARKAGVPWRGHHEWDPAADVGFSPGYTPEERRKLVDVYMADFKSIFGFYPRTAGSWFIDEVTLAYMSEKYGLVASCNCKDQIGTDGYTLWGGYWNQAYYPSRLNAYMPAQTEAGQINIPVFRMLGSDPIYQHGTTPGLYSLEPVYRDAGGSTNWVAWFMDALIHQPALAFGYTQAGQENSFGWDGMKQGLTQQIRLFATEAKAGSIRVETLAQSGQWFKDHFKLTPPTSVVVLDDWRHQNRKTIWYDSRYYRLNLIWQSNALFIRDLHCFDETVPSPTHETALVGHTLAYTTLPIVDSASWRPPENRRIRYPAALSLDGDGSHLALSGPPTVKELNATDLSIQQPLASGGMFSIVCFETQITFAGTDSHGKPLRWQWRLPGGIRRQSAIQSVTANSINYRSKGKDYELRLPADSGTCTQLDGGSVSLNPSASGQLIFTFETQAAKASANLGR